MQTCRCSKLKMKTMYWILAGSDSCEANLASDYNPWNLIRPYHRIFWFVRIYRKMMISLRSISVLFFLHSLTDTEWVGNKRKYIRIDYLHKTMRLLLTHSVCMYLLNYSIFLVPKQHLPLVQKYSFNKLSHQENIRNPLKNFNIKKVIIACWFYVANNVLSFKWTFIRINFDKEYT